MVIIHKLGYYYLPSGKKIALDISSATNKYRYTTNNSNKVELPNCELISNLLAQTPPFDISSGSHSELVRKFTIAKGGRKGFVVYIYESSESNKLKELKGSPFSSYAAGHVAIGLRPGSRVIGRYIDTNKLYKDNYLFSSVSVSTNMPVSRGQVKHSNINELCVRFRRDGGDYNLIRQFSTKRSYPNNNLSLVV